MNVAMVSSGREPIPVLRGGSVDSYAYYLAKHLAKLKVNILLYANRESTINNTSNFKFKPVFFASTKFEKFNYTFFNFLVLYNLLKERWNIDIVHTNLSLTTFLLSPFFKNIVFTSHSAYWWRSEATHKRQIGAIKKAKAVIAISRFIEKKMRLYKKENVFYIPNGVDIQLFKPKEHPFKKTLLTVCGISRQKGLIFLVKAFKEVAKTHKDFKWIHVGAIPDKSNNNFYYYLQLIKMIKRYGIKRYVNFLGRVDLKELIKTYQNSDIFILPSLWEGMPLVVLEAMSCGLPIISTKISGVEDLVTSNEGILVEPKNSKQLFISISSLLENEKETKRLGKNARKKVENNFSWEIIATKVKGVYETILKR